jgi:release factor glutamine methyltransferase
MSPLATVGAALAHARALGVDRLDAQLLVAHHLQRPRTWVLAHADEVLLPGAEAALRELLARRATGEPLAYLVGEREFHGLGLRVTPDVLIPRPDTETLVDWALELLAPLAAPRVVDLGTGSGAIALAVKRACPRAELHAVDISRAALAVARDNGQRLGLDVAWHAGSWWAAAPPLRFDLALSNPPYVAADDEHLAALSHEPVSALTPAGDDGSGLADIRRIAAGAPAHLKPGAWLLIEHGAKQAQAVRACLQAAGFAAAQTRADLGGQPRVSGAAAPPA